MVIVAIAHPQSFNITDDAALQVEARWKKPEAQLMVAIMESLLRIKETGEEGCMSV